MGGDCGRQCLAPYSTIFAGPHLMFGINFNKLLFAPSKMVVSKRYDYRAKGPVIDEIFFVLRNTFYRCVEGIELSLTEVV
jgi:hypothetical protein